MPFTLGGQVAVDPQDLIEALDEQDPPLPLGEWFGQANRFTNPRGPDHGSGWLLMDRGSLNKLDLNGYLPLLIDDLAGGRTTFPKIVVSGPPRCACPGLRGDLAATYAIPIADRRSLLKKIPIDRGYNLLNADGTDYLSETLDDSGCSSGSGGSGSGSGSENPPWTWQCLVDDLATILGIDQTLTLPYTPDGTPEGFAFYGMKAWDALSIVLDQLSCSIVYDPELDEFSVVELGATDTAADLALTAEDAGREWDADPVVPTYTRIPAIVRVAFRKFPAPDDGSSPYYTVDRDPPGSVTTSVFVGGVEWLFDGLGSTGSNTAALVSRATERAAKHYQRLLTGENPLQRRFIGIRTRAGLFPGSKIHAIVFQDVGLGWLTEVYRGPVARQVLPGVQDVIGGTDDGFWAIITELPVVDDSGSGSGDIGCSGSGDADSPTADCADGYGWKEAVNDDRFPGCGILAEPEPNLRSGTRCRNQAFEVNGRIDVPLFTRVWLKKQAGFDTYLFVAPAIASRDDPGGGFWAQLDSKPPESGSGAGSELEGIYCAPEAGKVSQRPGYAWQEIMSQADGESWIVRLGNFGTHCHKQAYEVNNFDAPVFVTDQDGFDHPTRVWMRLAPVDPDYRLELALAGLAIPDTYVFEFRPHDENSTTGSGGGSGCVGIPVSALFDCTNGTIRDACIAFVDGKLVLVTADGTVVAGG